METAGQAGQKVYEGAAIAGSVVKGKLDETGVTDVAVKAKTTVVENAKWAGTAVNEQIDANPVLSSAK